MTKKLQFEHEMCK